MLKIRQRIFLYIIITAGIFIYFLFFTKEKPSKLMESSVASISSTNTSFVEKDSAVVLAYTDKNGKAIDTRNVDPANLLAYAKTLIGVPYKYASANPAEGFDCSGFITYVFNHFGIAVPRSSIDFTNIEKEVLVQEARAGDLILFTGTDSLERFVGHMGIVLENTDTLRFIHSSSGKANGVTITPFNKYYVARFVKTIRVFPG